MHLKKSFEFSIAILAILGGVFSPFAAVMAQTTATSACTSDTDGKSRTQLQADLDACNAEIAQWTAELTKTQGESASFARDVSALTAKINAAQANIKAKSIAIANLTQDIAVKQAQIVELDDRINTGEQSIADIMRKTNDIDNYSLAEAVLSDKDFSQFFVDLDTYASTEAALANLFAELRGVKSLTETQKASLDQQRQAAAAAKAAIEAAKKEVETANAQKKTLLAQSQSKEKTYAQVLADRQAKAASIRAALFPLRDAGAIPFGTALQYADAASAYTGVRSALILGILQQESNLGQNVGTCVITNLSTGETKNINTGRVYPNGIHPTRDLPLLQSILAALGRDPLTTKVSCPLSVGYGGGMGPAQFIPSTWQIMSSKVASALGQATADPWNPRDAIMAAALFLRDLGAAAGTADAERTAACRYYGGGSRCTTTTASYGNSVMAKAANIQLTMIDPLKF